MRKTLAIYISDSRGKVECVWEFPLGPFVSSEQDAEILQKFKSGQVPWDTLTDAEEPEGWLSFKMEVRSYE